MQSATNIDSIKVIEKVEIQKTEQVEIIVVSKSTKMVEKSDNKNDKSEKTREEIMAERQAKKLSKQSGKQKIKDSSKTSQNQTESEVTDLVKGVADLKLEKSRDEVKADREAKKLAKQQAKGKKNETKEQSEDNNIQSKHKISFETPHPTPVSDVHQTEQIKTEKKILTKAERRALQEAQREAKTLQKEKQNKINDTVKNQVTQLKIVDKKASDKVDESKLAQKLVQKSTKSIPSQRTVKLFSHLYVDKIDLESIHNLPNIHPAIKRLGIQYATGVVTGSNARCIAFLNAMKQVISDYENSSQKEFSRGLEAQIQPCVNFLKKCRPISVSIENAWKAIIRQLTHYSQQESGSSEKTVIVLYIILFFIANLC